jgi:hypothetical protein
VAFQNSKGNFRIPEKRLKDLVRSGSDRGRELSQLFLVTMERNIKDKVIFAKSGETSLTTASPFDQRHVKQLSLALSGL